MHLNKDVYVQAATGFFEIRMQRGGLQIENEGTQKENLCMKVFGQFLTTLCTLEIVEKALQAAGRAPLPLPIKTAVHLAPLFLTYARYDRPLPAALDPLVDRVYGNYSSLHKVATLVSIVTLAYFGFTVFASAAFFEWGVDMMEGWMPEGVGRKIHFATTLFSTGVFVAYGTWVSRVVHALVLYLVWNEKKMEPIPLEEPLPQNMLTYSLARLILNKKVKLELAKPHLKERPSSKDSLREKVLLELIDCRKDILGRIPNELEQDLCLESHGLRGLVDEGGMGRRMVRSAVQSNFDQDRGKDYEKYFWQDYSLQNLKLSRDLNVEILNDWTKWVEEQPISNEEKRDWKWKMSRDSVPLMLFNMGICKISS